MILGLEIGLLIAGIIALVTGKFKLSKERVATGAAARTAGVVMILPLPLALAAAFVIGLVQASQGRPIQPAQLQTKITIVEACLVVACALLAFSIAAIAARPREDTEPRRRAEPKPQPSERGEASVAPVSAESIPYAEVVEEATTGLTQQPSPFPKAPHASPQGSTRRPTARVQSVKTSSSPVIWWVLGGLAACFFCCAIPAGGLLVWWLMASPSAQSTAPNQVARGRPLLEAENPPPDQKKEWGDQMQKLPQFNGPPGGGGPLPPGHLQPPPEPVFKPIVIPQPAAPHLNIRPPALPAERVVRPLPSAIGDTAVGGGGRFLILYLPRDRQLAIFDVNVAKVVKYLSFTDDIKFAAGMNKLLVALPDKNILQRWSLTTFERELSVPLAGEGQAQSLTMGSASNGPLLLRRGQQGPGGGIPSLTFFDIRTMKPLEVMWGNNNGGPLDGRSIRASANGKVFGLIGWGPMTLVWNDGRITISHRQQGGGIYALPSPDGQAIFTDAAIYTDSFKPAAGAAPVHGAMPATHGRYYMAGNSVYLLGDSRPLMTVPADNSERNANDPRDLRRLMIGNEALALDKRGYFIPDAKLLIHIPMSNDRLVLRRLDVEAGLEKSGIDYLFVVSQAPAKAKKGAIYSYQLAVKSKQGGVKYRVESGPKGMRISNTGRVTWRVPRFAAESEIDVILTISDKSGQEVFHSFRIHPGDQGEEQAAPLANLPAALDNPAGKQPAPVQAAEPERQQPAERSILPRLRPVPVVDPPPLEANKVVRKVPGGTICEIAVGGGGRYLVLCMAGREYQLAVFDVRQAKVTGYVPLPKGRSPMFTAGRDKLMVTSRESKVIECWDLATLKREAAAPLELFGRELTALAMGSASDGPILVAGAPQHQRGVTSGISYFLDLATLKPLPLRHLGAKNLPEDKNRNASLPPEHTGERFVTILKGAEVRASANGRLFSVWNGGWGGGAGAKRTDPPGLFTFMLEDDVVRIYRDPKRPGSEAGHMLPSPDGKVLYTPNGLLSNQFRAVGEPLNISRMQLPAVQPGYFMSIEGGYRYRRGDKSTPRGPLTVHRTGDDRPLAQVLQVELPPDLEDWDRNNFSFDKRIHLIPSANLIVTIGGDELVLHRFNVKQAIEKVAPARPSPSSGLGIKPPSLDKDRVEVLLPAEVRDLAVGGAGRYLVLYLSDQRKLAIFDVNAAKVVRWLPADDGEVRFAAGRAKLLLALGGQKVLQRWDLATGRREAVAPLPVREPIFALSMGSASAGPLLIAAKESTTLVDARTLKPLELEGAERGKMPSIGSKWVRASADGQTFTFRADVGGEPHTMFALTLRGGRASLQSAWSVQGSILTPSLDGRLLYYARGVLTSELRPIAPAGAAHAKKMFVPAEHGSYYLMLETSEGKSEPRLPRHRPPSGVAGGIGAVSFFVPGQENPLARLDDVEGVYHENIAYGQSSDPLPYDRRLHYIPDAQLLVSIPSGEDRLVLRRFNIEEALEKSDADYLLVTSLPPLQTRKGGKFIYRPSVKSKKGSVQVRLDSGPPGMKLSPDGVLTWPVPADFAEAEAEVLLSISDKSGQEIFHRFHILPSDRQEIPAPVSADIPPEAAKPAQKRVEPVIPPRKEGAVRELLSIRISNNSYVHALTFLPNGRELLSAGDDGRMRRWRVADGKELDTSFEAHPRRTMFSIGVSADGKRLLTSALDQTAKVWDAATHELLATCKPSERTPIIHAALSPDGKLLATGGTQVRLWDAASGREIGLLKSGLTAIDTLAFSADSKMLACTGNVNTVKLWNVVERKLLATLSGHSGRVMGLAFSADGKTLASASADNTIKLWDLATNKERSTLKGHADPLSSVAFSPDGKLLVSGAGAIRFNPGHLGEVKLWDTTTGQALADLRGHTDGVSSVAFSPDGKTIASTARDHTVRLWDASAYAERRTAKAP